MLNSTIVSKRTTATEKDLQRCEAIQSLLVQPLSVLPTEVGDPIHPVIIGFFQRVSPLLKPDASVNTLRRAIGAYVNSKRYYLGCLKADAMRHDIDGNPVEPVCDADRLNARERIAAFGQRTKQLPTSTAAPFPLSEAKSKRDLIRASLLTRPRS